MSTPTRTPSQAGGESTGHHDQAAMKNPSRYQTAFSRNIGWITPSEQAVLQTKRIAIADNYTSLQSKVSTPKPQTKMFDLISKGKPT